MLRPGERPRGDGIEVQTGGFLCCLADYLPHEGSTTRPERCCIGQGAASSLRHVEGAVDPAFQSETQKQITQLDTNLRQQAHDTQNRLHSIGLRFDEHQKDVSQQLMASSQSLEASLVKTMRHENQAIHGTLAALQEMFQENLGRKKPKESNE